MNHGLEIGCMLDAKTSEVLYDISQGLHEYGTLVEIGTGWGHSSKFFSAILPYWTIFTIDAFGLYGDGRIYKSYAGDYVKSIIDSHPANVIQILSNSHNVKWFCPIDALYIDGDHTYKGCKRDFEIYSPYLRPNGLLIFDDYVQENNPANGVKQVVDEITGYKMLFTGKSAIMQKL
jgi:predicted O-methyltransferase YrrM